MKGYFRKALPLLLTLLMVLGAVSVANATDSGASAGGDYTMPTQMEDNAQAGEKEEPEPKAQAEKPEQEAQVKKPESGTNNEKKLEVKAANPVRVSIPISKIMKGREWINGESYTFKIEAFYPDYTPAPVTDTLTLTAGEDPADELTGSFELAFPEYYDTYIYKITEQNTNNPGVSKDDRIIYAEVFVHRDYYYYYQWVGSVYYYIQDDPNDEPTPDTTYWVDTTSPTFENEYKEPYPPATFDIKTQKTYAGPEQSRPEFKYGLYTTDESKLGTEGIVYPEDVKPAEGTGKLIGELQELKIGTHPFNEAYGITFTKEGTYKFILKEDIPATPGDIVYDEHEVGVTVKVEYDKNNNRYTTAVTYDNSDAPSESDRNVTDKAAFTNTYAAEESATLEVVKSFTSDIDGWEWPADKSFDFVLTGKDGAPIRVKEGGQTVTKRELELRLGKAAPAAAFSKMYYTYDDVKDAENHTKTFEYNLHEDKGGTTVDGITYAADQTIKVTVTAAGGKLATSVEYEEPGESEAVMANKYSATGSVTAEVQATKSYLDAEGNAKTNWDGKTFDLQLIPTGDEPVPAITTKTASQNGPDVNFGPIEFTKTGVYYYSIKEVLPEGASEEHPVKDDVLYDVARHSVKITVGHDDKGNLTTPTVEYYHDSGTSGAVPVFYNRDLEDTDGYAEIFAAKSLEGTNLKSGEFSFVLYKSDAEGHVGEEIENTTAGADGGVCFEPIVYKHDAYFPGEDTQPKYVYYAVKEKNGGEEGFTYDSSIKRYKVTITHNSDHTLTTAVSYMDGNDWKPLTKQSRPEFKNTYKAEGEGTLKVHKDFESVVYGWKGWTDEEFTFTLKRKDSGKIRIRGEGSATKEVDSLEVLIDKDTVGHTEAFDNIIYNQSDLYDSESETYLTNRDIVYKISEEKSAIPNGIIYDSDKTVTVHIHDDGAGKILVTYTVGTTTGDAPVTLEFRNKYEINDSKTVKFKVSKTLTGRDWNNSDGFSFLLEAVTTGAPMPAQGGETVEVTSGSNPAEFGQISYTTAGIWRYKITETDAGSEAINEDPSEKFVTVTVEDGGNGTLKTPVVSYDNSDSVTEADSKVKDSAAFTNRYSAEGTAKPSLTKEFISDVHGWKGWTNEKFTFELKAKDGSNIRVRDGESTKLVKSIHGTAEKAQPVVNFGDIVYTQADMTQEGEYKAERSFVYTIHELRPTDPQNGIEYAEDRDIAVTVKDDGSGNLVTTIDYGNDTNGNAASSLVMTNKYVALGKVHAEIKARKVFLDAEGNEKTDWSTTPGGTAKTFDLELVPNDDEPVPPGADKETRITKKTAVQNAPVVDFGRIEYTEAGVYEYLVREKLPEGVSRDNPVHGGILYDPAEHYVKVVVKDDGQGGLKKPEVQYHQDPDDSGVMPWFKNSQLAEGTAIAEIMAGKKISGDSLRNGEFSFTLYKSDEEGTISDKIEDAGNDADGNVYFTPIIYRYNDIFDEQDTDPKVFYYAVMEDKGDNKGITYDESVKLYRVTVTADAEHKLTSTVEYKDGGSWKTLSADDKPVFNNSYDSKGEAQISLTKSLTSDDAVWNGWTDQKFSFELKSKDGEKIRTEKDGEYVYVDRLNGTASKDSPKAALRKIVYTRDDLIDKSAAEGSESYLDSRTFEYTVREIVPEDAKNNKYKGITYDSAERTVTVTISDNGDGTIKVVYGKDSVTETAPDLSFVNTYSVDDSKTAVIEVSKTLKGRDWETGDVFRFTLEAMTDGAPMPWLPGRTAKVTKSKTQDGFGKITYNKAGTWKYAVREKDSSIRGITCDNTVKYVTVTVADNGDGTLKAPVVTYDNSYSVSSDDAAVKDKAAFTNTYGGKGTNTGDSTSIAIELVTAVCAAALLAVMLIRKRREKTVNSKNL